jgi:hypothetical protein
LVIVTCPDLHLVVLLRPYNAFLLDKLLEGFVDALFKHLETRGVTGRDEGYLHSSALCCCDSFGGQKTDLGASIYHYC